ncbi:PE family protein [Segniliparus rugosus]|uniref:PE domain-containing protein n=1 Tax=Segniliparus rugosus (strain ATCC BAA-974 / DSM 45345 / CCUG 50838 / CIP 108380 / JCM 13579 / CDC 945) TaxID=679197 RepID=U1LMB4_SEGRC|nr:PE family protein [Segniliparus rugosus]ERG69111.1 hypothetical protein HMPREF9336_04255 [Segniliparus rugosus ATCC BAA-974]
MTMRVLPEGLLAASAAVEAITARLAAAHAASAPTITSVVPPAADPVSLLAAAEFGSRALLHQGAAGEGMAELGRGASGIAETATSYAEGDALAAEVYATEAGRP